LNRAQWQYLAEERLLDTALLLNAQRWATAYYLAGYAVECGLKSCVLHHLERTGVIFQDRDYLKQLGGCWTHELDKLVYLAGLTVELGRASGAKPALAGYWGIAKDWKETSRYEQKTEIEARELHEAITNEPDGVLRWIRTHW
jgi:hypothetical protein